MFYKKNYILILIFLVLLNLNSIYGNNDTLSSKNLINLSKKENEDVKKTDKLNLSKITKSSKKKKKKKKKVKPPTNNVTNNLEKKDSKNYKNSDSRKYSDKINELMKYYSKKKKDDSDNQNKNKSIFSKIKNFFKKKELPRPKTLMEYIKLKNDRILKLELKRDSKRTERIIYKVLFYTTATVLAYIVTAPIALHLYRAINSRNVNLEQYEKNKDRRIVPYNYDFDDPVFMTNCGIKFANYQRYYHPNRWLPNFAVGYYDGDPYFLIKFNK